MNEKKIKNEVKRRYSKIADEGSSCCSSCKTYGKSIIKQSESIGYSEDELAARPFAEFIHPDDRQTAVRPHDHGDRPLLFFGVSVQATVAASFHAVVVQPAVGNFRERLGACSLVFGAAHEQGTAG